jgi:hypothetical protein
MLNVSAAVIFHNTESLRVQTTSSIENSGTPVEFSHCAKDPCRFVVPALVYALPYQSPVFEISIVLPQFWYKIHAAGLKRASPICPRNM